MILGEGADDRTVISQSRQTSVSATSTAETKSRLGKVCRDPSLIERHMFDIWSAGYMCNNSGRGLRQSYRDVLGRGEGWIQVYKVKYLAI